MWERPAREDVLRAVEAYLAAAYDAAAPPPAVAERLATLRCATEGSFYDCGAFEPVGNGYALRLGNRYYPHMKLVVEAGPGGCSLFRADTHDRHFHDLVEPSEKLAELMSRNATIARAIEEAWAACGLLTAREHLRRELSRWRAGRP
jgi:hypothetical protein